MLLPLRVLINSFTRLTSLKDMVFLCFFVVILRCGNFQTFDLPQPQRLEWTMVHRSRMQNATTRGTASPRGET